MKQGVHFDRRLQKGMTFLEVIVAILVFGLGLAMTVSMMQASHRFGMNAEYRAIATREAQSLIDHMRANYLGLEGYVPNVAKPCDAIDAQKEEKKHKACETAMNAAKSRASQFMAFWEHNLQAQLPNAIHNVTRNSVTITWRVEQDEHDITISDANTVRIEFEL